MKIAKIIWILLCAVSLACIAACGSVKKVDKDVASSNTVVTPDETDVFANDHASDYLNQDWCIIPRVDLKAVADDKDALEEEPEEQTDDAGSEFAGVALPRHDTGTNVRIDKKHIICDHFEAHDFASTPLWKAISAQPSCFVISETADLICGMPKDFVDTPYVLVHVTSKGLDITNSMRKIEPVDECPKEGETLCLKKDGKGVDRYDWVELYNILLDLKMRSEYFGRDSIFVYVDKDISSNVVAKLVETVRYQRAHDRDAIKGQFIKDETEYANSQTVLYELMDIQGNISKVPAPLFTNVKILHESTYRSYLEDVEKHAAEAAQKEAVEQREVSPASQMNGLEGTGSLDKRIIQKIVRQHSGELRNCYEIELAKNKDLNGKIVVNWLISPQGAVTKVIVKESTMNNTNVEKCVMDNIKTWRFPAPKGEGSVSIVYPFSFENGR